jgi:hypothetical protein
MKRREFPMGPWVDVAVDFLGPFPNGLTILAVVDYYSRYMEFEVMRQTTALWLSFNNYRG